MLEYKILIKLLLVLKCVFVCCVR